jgi:hypothetical protein
MLLDARAERRLSETPHRRGALRPLRGSPETRARGLPPTPSCHVATGMFLDHAGHRRRDDRAARAVLRPAASAPTCLRWPEWISIPPPSRRFELVASANFVEAAAIVPRRALRRLGRHHFVVELRRPRRPPFRNLRVRLNETKKGLASLRDPSSFPVESRGIEPLTSRVRF